ncbi:GPR1/FUN34/yaaH family-domain-containing protein [Rhodotorula diobovata]|uniref:GPR1/FUN34/yaaH family-domain-containing protein n=1 Tax=Rhodotorula diobovata TaxID=5288 RepID=A0A5C5G781_9BASI|nr:GPR1/FUN34/yaaH family-domain-containing protein [Rhodotorula diobovata]
MSSSSTSSSPVHRGTDLEKASGHTHHGAEHAHSGHVGTSSASPAYMSQDGGAPFDVRNITPGGHPLDRSQPAFPTYHRKFANPAPLGLCGFALTTFMLSLINMSARGVTVPNVVVGPALFYGGLAQLLAGMWEFASGNTFAATAFTSYGAFWLSYAFIVSPWSGIAAAYEGNEAMFANGVAFFLFGWLIFSTIMLIASLRSSIALSSVFFFLVITLVLLGVSELGDVGNSSAIHTAGGAFGMVTTALAWYVAAANLLTPDTSYFTLPVGDMSKKD